MLSDTSLGMKQGFVHDMIQGWFDDNEPLFFEIELIADNGLELPVDALLDTGFYGWLAMDSQSIWDFRLEIEELKKATSLMNPGDLYPGGCWSTVRFNRSPVAEKSAVSSWYVGGYFDIGSELKAKWI